MSHKLILHPKPTQEIFSICRPAPYYKMKLYDEHPILSFKDPDTEEEYQAQRICETYYPMNLISPFVCRICAQKEPEDLVIEMQQKYKLSATDEVGFYLFKLVN